MSDAAGNWCSSITPRHADNVDFGRVVMLDEITWTNDWPVFGNGGTPTTTAQTGPIISARRRPHHRQYHPTARPLALTIFATDEDAGLA